MFCEGGAVDVKEDSRQPHASLFAVRFSCEHERSRFAVFNLEAPLRLRTDVHPWVAVQAGRRGHGIRPCHSPPGQRLTPKRRQRLAGEAARRHILSCCSNAARPPGRNSRTPERTAVLLSVSAFWSSCERSLSGHQNRARLPLGTACEGTQNSDCFRVIM